MADRYSPNLTASDLRVNLILIAGPDSPQQDTCHALVPAGFVGRRTTKPMPSRLTWFDHEFDSSGKPIRDDVREAARKKWPYLLGMAKARIGDRELEIQELFEQVIVATSSYLDETSAPPQDASGLLVLKFRRQLSTLARKLGRVVVSGNSSDMEPLLATTDWSESADRQLMMEEIVRLLSPRNRTVLRLRQSGYDWTEISHMLKCNSSTLRNAFWREIRRVYSELMGTPLDTDAERSA